MSSEMVGKRGLGPESSWEREIKLINPVETVTLTCLLLFLQRTLITRGNQFSIILFEMLDQIS